MIAAKQMDIRANIKKYFDTAFDGEPVIVSRKQKSPPLKMRRTFLIKLNSL
jgi:hypothetical protein